MTNTASSMIRRGMSVLVIGGALVATALAGSTGAQANGFGGHGFGGHGFGGHGWGHHGWGHGGGFGLAVGLGGDDYYGSTRVWQPIEPNPRAAANRTGFGRPHETRLDL